jgi:NAD(P)-dependent dehydrogenase (short-subunit alcohol dehydrogenase family)
MKTWFVTGASRGLGAHIVAAALHVGDTVVATARDPRQIASPDAADARFLALPLDVLDEGQAQHAVDAAMARFGCIDVLVNNAGRGLLGAVEEATDTAARAVFDVNVFGTLNVLRAVLPAMRARRAGHVINLSSVGGFVGSPGWGIYNATKFAVEGLSEALAAEVGPLGIGVTVVEPGYFRTDFLDDTSLHTVAAVLGDYADTAGAMRQRASTGNHLQLGDPAKAAAALVALALADHPPLRIQLGSDSYDRVAEKLRHVAAEQASWRALSLSTDHT